MKLRAFAALIVAGLSMTAAPTFAQQGRDRNNGGDNRDTDRVCFYRDIEYQGPSWCYRPGDELADLRNRGNEISSIRIFGRARVIVWDGEEFMGVTDEFDMDVPDLRLRAVAGRRNWNDRIDSFRVIAFNRRGRGFGFGRDDARDNRPARDRICIYEEINYGGRSQCWNADEEERNLSGTGWNDRISSIRVYGRARIEVYRDADYRGQRLRIERDSADLGAINWSDQISSFQVR
jgi:Peptidase inhibitor family I36